MRPTPAEDLRAPNRSVCTLARDRPENRLLLGPHDEVVSRRGGPEGSLASSGEALSRAEPRYVFSALVRGLRSWNFDGSLLWTCRLPLLPYLAFLLHCARLALTATGVIWVRYSMVITPINYSLAAVRGLRRFPSNAPFS